VKSARIGRVRTSAQHHRFDQASDIRTITAKDRTPFALAIT
jgi:hypothetical protein